MKAESERAIELKVKQSGRWTRVYAEAGGKDVSHLVYFPRRLQMGAKSTVVMASIGGVGTERSFRRRGLARRALACAMERIRDEGYSCAGLYTSTRIVAHRLYRRFGFVDVSRRRMACKVLDPGRFACHVLSDMIGRNAELRRRRPTLRLSLHPHGTIHVKLEESEVRLLSRAPRRVDLSLQILSATILALWEQDISFPYAEAAGLFEWQGDAAVYRLLADALTARHQPVNEE